MFLGVSVFLVAAAVGWFVYLFYESRAVRRAISARVRSKLGKLGLDFTGDPLGTYTLQGEIQGVAMKAYSRFQIARPGAREGESQKTALVVRLSLRLPDLIVCRRADVDRVMGPLPSVRRTLTGQSEFDDGYALFISNLGADVSEGMGGYREAGTTDARGWTKPPILERLKELGLDWIRVRDGAGEVVFELLGPEDAIRAITTCVNISHAMSGLPLLPVKGGERAPREDVFDPLAAVLIGPFAGLFLGAVVGIPLSDALAVSGITMLLCFAGVASLLACAMANLALLQARIDDLEPSTDRRRRGRDPQEGA